MKAYWWRPEPKINNFGDELNDFILSKLGFAHEWAKPEDAELVIAGSVLEHLPDYWTGTVAGAGKMYENSRIHLPDARVFALRGKLTQAGVAGLDGHKPVLGDPGLVTPLLVRQPEARYDLGVALHWSDTELYDRFAYGHRIDVTQPVEKVIQEIASCKRIISSSLHGLIVADAFGIPRQAEIFERAEQEGGDFKFRDYQSVYSDNSPHFGEMWLAPREEVAAIQHRLLDALTMAAPDARPRHRAVSTRDS